MPEIIIFKVRFSIEALITQRYKIQLISVFGVVDYDPYEPITSNDIIIVLARILKKQEISRPNTF